MKALTGGTRRSITLEKTNASTLFFVPERKGSAPFRLCALMSLGIVLTKAVLFVPLLAHLLQAESLLLHALRLWEAFAHFLVPVLCRTAAFPVMYCLAVAFATLHVLRVQWRALLFTFRQAFAFSQVLALSRALPHLRHARGFDDALAGFVRKNLGLLQPFASHL